MVRPNKAPLLFVVAGLEVCLYDCQLKVGPAESGLVELRCGGDLRQLRVSIEERRARCADSYKYALGLEVLQSKITLLGSLV